LSKKLAGVLVIFSFSDLLQQFAQSGAAPDKDDRGQHQQGVLGSL